MSRRYDTRTTTFSPDGRLFQVEYAIEAISAAGVCIGIQCKDGVVMVAEKKFKSKLWVPERSEKFYNIDAHQFVAVAGITADAAVLVDFAQRVANYYRFQFQAPMPVGQTVQRVCDLQQSYTQYGAQRPFGVSMLWGAWDEEEGYQLFASDPSGNFAEWSATAVGRNSKAAKSILKEDYKEDITLEEGVQLCIKILTKTMDSPQLDAEKLEMAVLQKGGFEQFKPEKVTKIIKDYEAAEKKKADDKEAEKKAKSKAKAAT